MIPPPHTTEQDSVYDVSGSSYEHNCIFIITDASVCQQSFNDVAGIYDLVDSQTKQDI